jgi:hypothetical protein
MEIIFASVVSFRPHIDNVQCMQYLSSQGCVRGFLAPLVFGLGVEDGVGASAHTSLMGMGRQVQ